MIKLWATLIGYFFGNFLFATIIGHFFLKADPTKFGSGNPGTANVGAVFGKKWGVLTCLGDLAKTAAALFIVHNLFVGQIYLAYTGLGLILGHCFPILDHFKGGKGVAVAALLTVVYNWQVGIITLLIALLLTVIMQNLTIPPLVFILLFSSYQITQNQEAGIIFFLIAIVMIFQFRHDIVDFFTGHGKKVDILRSLKQKVKVKYHK